MRRQLCPWLNDSLWKFLKVAKLYCFKISAVHHTNVPLCLQVIKSCPLWKIHVHPPGWLNSTWITVRCIDNQCHSSYLDCNRSSPSVITSLPSSSMHMIWWICNGVLMGNTSNTSALTWPRENWISPKLAWKTVLIERLLQDSCWHVCRRLMIRCYSINRDQ